MTFTHWIVVAYALVGLFIFTRMALILRSARTYNGDRLRWPIMAAFAWAHLVAALTWSITPFFPGLLSRQFVRGAVIAMLLPVSFLSLRCVWSYWRSGDAPIWRSGRKG